MKMIRSGTNMTSERNETQANNNASLQQSNNQSGSKSIIPSDDTPPSHYLDECDMVVGDLNLHLDNALASLTDCCSTLMAGKGGLVWLLQRTREEKAQRAAELLGVWGTRLTEEIARLSDEVKPHIKTMPLLADGYDHHNNIALAMILSSSEFHSNLFRANYNKQRRQVFLANFEAELSAEEMNRLRANWVITSELLKIDVVLGCRAKAALLQCLEAVKKRADNGVGK